MGIDRTVTEVVVIGEIDVATLDGVRESVLGAVASQSHVIVDCVGCTFIDSATLGMFLDAHTRCNDNGSKLVLVVTPGGPVSSIITMAHFDSVLTIADTMDNARNIIEEGS